jgi:hypothetical protein
MFVEEEIMVSRFSCHDATGGYSMTPAQADNQPALLEPFGLYFRQRPAPLSISSKGQTTSEPEITTGDGNDPDNIDSIWIPDEDEEPDEDPPGDPSQQYVMSA